MFETDFLYSSSTSHNAHRDAVLQALDALQQAWPKKPYTGAGPANISELLSEDPLPERGIDFSEALAFAQKIISNSIVPSNSGVMAHLHCAPLIPTLAAEVILTALNQSMDSFDQAPAATIAEQKLVRWLAKESGFPSNADGTFTAGGSQSNYIALLLARDACIESRFSWNVRERGLPPETMRLRILCSEMAHFTIEKSAAQLGLGTTAVIKVATDDEFRMDARELKKQLAVLEASNLIPMAIVATAGTTDFGCFDPLPEITTLAHGAGAWLHVDAAYGGALLFSSRRALLNGLEQADSFSVDFHKSFWQPISCAALMLHDARNFRFLEMHSDYLNPKSHEEQGIPDLVNRSVLTTRRFDALKLWISLRTLGRQKLAAMIDRTAELAQRAARTIEQSENLELLHHPQFGCVVFCYRPRDLEHADRINAEIRHRLFDQGRAVIGHTRVRGRQLLKLTILNPTTTEQQLTGLLQEVQNAGREIEARG